MLVSLVSASLVWSFLLEYKINKNKKRSKRGNWPSSLVWLCLLEQKKKNVEICWSLQFMLIQFCLAFWNRKLTQKKKKDQNVEIGLLVYVVWICLLEQNFLFKKKKSGKMLVSLVFASVVWFCFSEYKIKHTQKKKKRKRKKKIRTWKLVFQYGLVLPFGIEI